MAVAIEASPEGEPGFISQTTDELLQLIYEDFLFEDEYPAGIKVCSEWGKEKGELAIRAPALGNAAILATFDKDTMDLMTSVLPLSENIREVLLGIRASQTAENSSTLD